VLDANAGVFWSSNGVQTVRMCHTKQHRARAHSADIGGLFLATSDREETTGRGWMGADGPGIEYVSCSAPSIDRSLMSAPVLPFVLVFAP